MYSVINELRDYQIADICLSPHDLGLQISLVSAVREKSYIVQLRRIAQLNISKLPDDVLNCPDIFEMEAKAVKGAALKDLLDKLDHCHFATDGSRPEYGGMHHLRIVGEICVDVLCAGIQVYEERDAK